MKMDETTKRENTEWEKKTWPRIQPWEVPRLKRAERGRWSSRKYWGGPATWVGKI